MVLTRRALLGAGAVVLLGGCGPTETVEPALDDVLVDQLRAEQAVVVAYEGLTHDDRLAGLQAHARERVRRIEAALPPERVSGAPPPRPAQPEVEYALEAERHALRVHVQSVGLTRDREARALFADLVADSARSESGLLTVLERPPAPSAFPGQPL